MQLRKDKSALQDFHEASRHEWLETNGLGGWASASITGCNTRRYHGLLVAATVPPAERTSLVSKLEEAVLVDDRRFELGTNQYEQNIVQPNGHQYMESFQRKLFPEWTYEVNGITLRKTILMVHEENTTVLLYDILKAERPFEMEFLPLISARGYHALQNASTNMFWDAHFENGNLHYKPNESSPDIHISIPGSSFTPRAEWFYHFYYAVENYRGLDCREDLFTPGFFRVPLKEGDSLGVILSTRETAGRDAHELLSAESLRRQLLLKQQPEEVIIQQLTLAADQFIVNRSEDRKSIIAGYHWFTDWGRDTMVSLPGLCLATGRYKDARKILTEFSKHVSNGMLPNRFRDGNEPPEYNNVDGTLWYFIAIYQYLMATKDHEFILTELLPVLEHIIEWHLRGTRYQIHVDEDGLLFAGEKGQQLTWMDARIGDWVVTPRMGKPVEIQALWYNALKIFSGLLAMNREQEKAVHYNQAAEITGASFVKKFWFEEGGYLYDVIDENGVPDGTLRPNQIFAISLPFPLLDKEKANSVLDVVANKLYTPVGLRTLPADHPAYVGVYGGDPFKRDSSYHQGTVWSWLLGAYIDSIMKVDPARGRKRAMDVIGNFQYHLNEGCIGSISEIYDADPPHHPRGCVAQAWSVGEILRVIREYRLYDEGEMENRDIPVKEEKSVAQG